MGYIEDRLQRLEERRYPQKPEADRYEAASAYLEELHERRQAQALERAAAGVEAAPKTDAGGARSKALAELWEVVERREAGLLEASGL